MKFFDFKHMTPLRWVLIGLAVAGLAGLVYWLLLPTAKKVAASPILKTLNNLTGNLIQVSPDEDYTTVDGADRGSGNYTANPNWEVGDYGAESGSDFQGNPFVRSAAPTIPFEAKVRPYIHGVDYNFPEQTAKGAALIKRFPEFSLVDTKLHLMGPWYSDANANAHFSRGVTTITAQPTFRQGPQSVVNLPANRKNSMVYDPVFWSAAQSLAASGNFSGEALEALNAFGNNHYVMDNEEAFVAIGRTAWQTERYVTDAQGQGYRYLSVDIEVSDGYENYRSAVGYIYKGFCNAALEEGITVRPFTYYGPQQTTIFGISNRQNGNGDPEYLNDHWDFLANQDATVQAVKQFAGILANDTYMQGIWGNEPLLARDGSGMPMLDGDGFPIFSSQTQTTVYGQSIYLESNEAQYCLRDLYEQSVRLYLINHRLAGGYPSVGGMRKAGFEGTKTGSFTRYTNEGLQGLTQNDRPVPAWQMELFNGLNLFLTQHLWCWGAEFNHAPDALGSNHSEMWEYQAHGVAESVLKAAHRHAAFSNIQASAFKWCWFNLAVVNDMRTDGDGYQHKAICHGKIRNVNRTVWLEVFLAFPATDNRSTLFQVWAHQGTIQSGAFQCALQSGRHYFYDCFPLPSSFSYDDIDGSNIYLTYPDAMNVQRYHRGDYRATIDSTSIPQPA